jgi:hypothetical protein
MWMERIMKEPNICLQGLRKAMQNHNQDTWPLIQELNLGPPKCEAGMLTTTHCNVHLCWYHYLTAQHTILTQAKKTLLVTLIHFKPMGVSEQHEIRNEYLLTTE